MPLLLLTLPLGLAVPFDRNRYGTVTEASQERETYPSVGPK